jgi:hypothetical protein
MPFCDITFADLDEIVLLEAINCCFAKCNCNVSTNPTCDCAFNSSPSSSFKNSIFPLASEETVISVASKFP